MAEGLSALGWSIPDEALAPLKWLSDELLRWNSRVNLTAVTDPGEVIEKHLLDSLAILSALKGLHSLIDLGAGAGFPGLPVALALPALQVQLVDSVGKKVGFMKHVIAGLNLAPRVKAVQATARGAPGAEGIQRTESVVCRALMELAPWLALARPYLVPGGRAIAMVSRLSGREAELAKQAGFEFARSSRFRLPWSGAERAVLEFELRAPTFHVEQPVSPVR